MLSARHRGESIVAIRSWPMYVYVSLLSNQDPVHVDGVHNGELHVVAWGRLYPTIREAASDVARHTSASESLRSPRIVHAPQLRFLSERDGLPEQVLKEKLRELFACDQRIWKAYLATVDYGHETSSGVVLCLRTVMGPDSALVTQVVDVFAALFRTDEHLDVLFLDDEQERHIERGCKPFYVRVVTRRV